MPELGRVVTTQLVRAAIGAALVTTACTSASDAGVTARSETPTLSQSPSTTAAATPSLPSTPTVSPTLAPAPPPTPRPGPSLDISVTQADYGALSVSTTAGASCTASAALSDGTPIAGMGGSRTADGAGKVSWTYLQAPTNAREGLYTIHCSMGTLQATATANFQPGN